MRLALFDYRFLEEIIMNDEMKLGAKIAYQSVKEEMDTILAELSRKGFDKPKGFSILQGFIEDSMKELD